MQGVEEEAVSAAYVMVAFAMMMVAFSAKGESTQERLNEAGGAADPLSLLMPNGACHAFVQHLHTNKCWDETHPGIGRQPLTHANQLRVEPGH